MCWACEESTIRMPRVITDETKPFLMVDDNSPMNHRKAVEKIARFFQQETKNGFLQYSASNPSGKKTNFFIPTIAYLFTEEETLHYTKSGKRQIGTKGACCFRRREYSNLPEPIWEIDWVWLHPFERGKTFFPPLWKCITARFDIVFPSRPISKSMKRFLMKNNFPISPFDYFQDKK